MASVTMEILEDIAAAIRSDGSFSLVTLGESPSATDTPRAAVTFDGQESFQPDDSATSRWGRLRASVTVRVRSVDQDNETARADELCQAAIDAILNDPYRGGRCEDLPIGQATEIGRVEAGRQLRRPEIERTFSVRCHFETQEAS